VLADVNRTPLTLEGCTETDAREVRRLVALELSEGPREVEDGAVDQGFHVRCAGDYAELSRRGEPVQRRLAIAGVPVELRPRLIALAVAELASMPAEPAAPAQVPEPPAARIDAPSTTPPPTPTAEPRFYVGAGALGQVTPVRSMGGALSFEARLLRHFAWLTRAHYARGQRSLDLGTLHMTQLGVRTGPELTGNYAPFTLSIGLGARMTLLRLRGESDDAETAVGKRVQRLVAGPDLHVGLLLAMGRHGFLALDFGGYYAMRALRVRTLGGSARTLRGLYAEATLGGGLAW
jgi:hypothetical protein